MMGCNFWDNTSESLPYKEVKFVQYGYWEKLDASAEGWAENNEDGIRYIHLSFYKGGSDYNSCDSAADASLAWASWVELPSTSECGWEEDTNWQGLDTDDGIGFDKNYVPECTSYSDRKCTQIHYYVDEKYIEYIELGETETSILDIEELEANTSSRCGFFINFEE